MLTQESIKQLRRELHTAIFNTLVTEPDLTQPEVAAKFGTSLKTICNVMKANGLHRTPGRKPRVDANA
jgi:hypothetical protein